MSFSDTLAGAKQFWKEFKKEKISLVGAVFLGIFLLIIIFEPLLVTHKGAGKEWRNITYWEDESPSAPPAWTNLFRSEKWAVSSRMDTPEVTNQEDGSEVYSFFYDFDYDQPPNDIILRAGFQGDLGMMFSVIRPDGEEILLMDTYQEAGDGADFRMTVKNDAVNRIFRFLRGKEDRAVLQTISPADIKPIQVLFAEAKAGMVKSPEILKGTYEFRVTIMPETVSATTVDPEVIIPGKVSGFLGTDAQKRDIYSGVIVGFKWALLIGLVTAVLTVLVGVSYGIIQAYFGGSIDAGMQFFQQVVIAIPLLPVLIVLSAVFKPSLWMMLGGMILLMWGRPVVTVRSMALQIREETYIEAAKALGASHGRIIFRHMFPILIPYSFALMALQVPAAIVTESSISLLGLGDPSITTWGQILNAAYKGGAVLNGLWWWVIPPGIAIALVGMTFAFIGFGLDKMLNPKLKHR